MEQIAVISNRLYPSCLYGQNILNRGKIYQKKGLQQDVTMMMIMVVMEGKGLKKTDLTKASPSELHSAVINSVILHICQKEKLLMRTTVALFM